MTEPIRAEVARLLPRLETAAPCKSEADNVEWWKDTTEAITQDEAEALAAAPRLVRDLDARVATLEAALAKCYRLTGADPDGNEDWRLAPDAVTEVARLRSECDEDSAKLATLTAERDEALDIMRSHKNISKAMEWADARVLESQNAEKRRIRELEEARAYAATLTAAVAQISQEMREAIGDAHGFTGEWADELDALVRPSPSTDSV